jgi:hypothetical protein
LCEPGSAGAGRLLARERANEDGRATTRPHRYGGIFLGWLANAGVSSGSTAAVFHPILSTEPISVASARRKVVQQRGRKRAVVERKLDGDKTYVLWFMWCRLDAE